MGVCTCGCLHTRAVHVVLCVCPPAFLGTLWPAWALWFMPLSVPTCAHVQTPAPETGAPTWAHNHTDMIHWVLTVPLAQSGTRPLDSEQVLLLVWVSPRLHIRSHITLRAPEEEDAGFTSQGGGIGKRFGSQEVPAGEGPEAVADQPQRGQPATCFPMASARTCKTCGQFDSTRKR